MASQKCSHCKELKSPAEFSRNRISCKACDAGYHAAWLAKNADKAKVASQRFYSEHSEQSMRKAREWQKAHPESLRDNTRKGQKAYNTRHPQRVKARRMLQQAVASGEIIKQPCVICGSDQAQAHHDDYAKPLDVIWFCRPHHLEHHRKLKMGQVAVCK